MKNRSNFLILLSVVLVLLLSILLTTTKTLRKTPIKGNNITSQNTSPSTHPINPSLNDSKTKFVYKDEHISYEYPPNWTAVYNQHTDIAYLIDVDYFMDCNKYRVISFFYITTDIKDPKSYLLGQKNPYGPKLQTSEIVLINSISMGIRIEPQGDGSGGYEPKTVVDFLSKSRKFHYYFIAVQGCRESSESTYQFDLLPILNSINLFD